MGALLEVQLVAQRAAMAESVGRPVVELAVGARVALVAPAAAAVEPLAAAQAPQAEVRREP